MLPGGMWPAPAEAALPSDRQVSLPSLRERPPAPTNDAGGAGAASGKQSHLAPRPTSSRFPIPQMDAMLECWRSHMRV